MTTKSERRSVSKQRTNRHDEFERRVLILVGENYAAAGSLLPGVTGASKNIMGRWSIVPTRRRCKNVGGIAANINAWVRRKDPSPNRVSSLR